MSFMMIVLGGHLTPLWTAFGFLPFGAGLPALLVPQLAAGLVMI